MWFFFSIGIFPTSYSIVVPLMGGNKQRCDHIIINELRGQYWVKDYIENKIGIEPVLISVLMVTDMICTNRKSDMGRAVVLGFPPNTF